MKLCLTRSIGISIQVLGQIDPHGIHALFGLDEDGSRDGGTICAAIQGSFAAGITQQDPLFDSGSMGISPASHTLFITNQGRPLSLEGFLVFGTISETETSTQHTSTISSQHPASSSLSSKSPGSIFPTANPVSLPVGTTSHTQQASTGTQASYMVSSYTEVSVTGTSIGYLNIFDGVSYNNWRLYLLNAYKEPPKYFVR